MYFYDNASVIKTSMAFFIEIGKIKLNLYGSMKDLN